ncbi:protein POLAR LOCALIZATION DURING ASYMMETRIC DIVISION AND REDISTRIBUTION-like [Iris pallida]|uniref:Protein POLAR LOCALIZATION DURING ASYMMETRIC DIVISION AND REDISTRIBUTION-like n=1 Tax=Iris pallida TaxID=29817 RepID=A0AAX6GK36_IRIPA|nr:protein POLAR LOCALIZATION DURING ASYMMETRIC DIVISION AND REDISTRIBUTION-like [Iris pallida]
MSLSSFFFSCSSTRHNKNSQESMRIADVLSEEGEEEEEEEEARRRRRRRVLHKAPTFSSRSVTVLSRWFSKKKLAGPGSLPVPVRSDKEVSVSVSAAPGATREELSYNLGMGMGLAFLLAKSAAEVNKTMELRAQMEMLLKEVRTEIRRKDAICSSSGSSNNNNNNVSDSVTSSFGSSNRISISPPRCCGDASTGMAVSKDVCGAGVESESNYVTAGNTRNVSLDQMEAELELELERLETNLEGESSSAGLRRAELNHEKDDPSFESFGVTYEEEEGIIPQDTDEYNGVSAHELERRLHELLATRQQEQIAELQSRLECMEQKLREKEFELCLWKQTKCFDLQDEGASPRPSDH